MTLLSTGLSTSSPLCIVKATDGNLVMVNGVDRPRRWDGITTSLELAGITSPTAALTVAAASTAGTLWGTYKCYYRYLDNASQPGNLSPVATLAITSGAATNKIKYSALVTSPETRVTQIQVWRTTHGQTKTVYLDATIADTVATTSSTRTDGNLKTQTSMRIETADGYANANRFTVPPRVFTQAVSYLNRIWYLACISSNETTYRNALAFSEAGEPESVPSANYVYMQDDGDQIIGGMAVAGNLYVLKHHHIYRVTTAGDPRRDIGFSPVAARGIAGPKCWEYIEGLVYMMDEYGAYTFDGASIEPISGPVQNFWRGSIDWTYKDWFHVRRCGQEETVRFYFSLEGTDTYPAHALCYNYRTKEWTEDSYRWSVRAIEEFPFSGEDLLVGGGTSALYVMTGNVTDGLVSGSYWHSDTTAITSTLEGTIDTIGQATVSPYGLLYYFSDASATFSFAASEKYIGAFVQTYSPTTGAVRTLAVNQYIISQDTANCRLYWYTMSIPPAAGDYYAVGGIDWQIKLGAFQFVESERSNPRRLRVWFKPVTTFGKMFVSFYLDHSTTAESAAITYDDGRGVSVTSGATAWVVDLTRTEGYAEIPIDDGFESLGPANRVLEVKLFGVTSGKKIRIYGVDIDGVVAVNQ